MSSTHNILLLGAGELGSAFLMHLRVLPEVHITLARRDTSKSSSSAGTNVTLLSLDHQQPVPDLAEVFTNYDTIISCTGFGQPLGTQKRLAEAVLEAGKLKKSINPNAASLWYFPWQWGVDYDVTGDANGLMPLFGEQLEVRNLLRAKAVESNVKWTIVSTGIFMSFLFEPFWGVFEQGDDVITVRALGSWEHKVTVTTADDIAKVVARIVSGDVESENRVLYIAGDTVTYKRLSDIVGLTFRKPVRCELWDMAYLKRELASDPENELKKYRVVFAGDGVWWDKEATVNHKLQLPLTGVEAWLRRRFLDV
jgi:hypothetical protein